jgi:hypothetical protein
MAAQRYRRNTPHTGKATMLPAKNAQISVCRSLIVVSNYFIPASVCTCRTLQPAHKQPGPEIDRWKLTSFLRQFNFTAVAEHFIK